MFFVCCLFFTSTDTMEDMVVPPRKVIFPAVLRVLVMQLTVLALASVICLLIATAGSYVLLTERPSFGYTPFLTSASRASAVVSAAWVMLAWAIGERPRDSDWFIRRDPRATARAAGLVLPFLWARGVEPSRVAGDVDLPAHPVLRDDRCRRDTHWARATCL